jgi:glycerol-1-phosphate dehydrogenase [NAD(P)+]
MMMNLHGGDWMRIKDALRKIGAPTTADELGIEIKYFLEALTTCHKIRPDRYTILGEKGLTKEAALRLANVTGVIN